MYDPGPNVPIEYVEPGTNVLVSGPPATNARDLAFELLAAGQRRADGVLLVSTEIGAVPLVAAYQGAGGSDDEDLRVVDATGRGPTDHDRVDVVDSPGDITEIGSAMGRRIEDYVTLDTEGLRIGLVSVTAMLDHLDRGSVYKFLRTVNARIDRAGFLGIGTIDSDRCNEQTVGMMADAFDVLLELRETADGTEFRVIAPEVDRNWRPLDL